MIRKILLIAIIGLNGSAIFAQNFEYVSESEYANRKAQGLLNGNEVLLSEGMVSVKPKDIYQEYLVTEKAQGCGGYTPPPGPALNVTSLDDGWVSSSPLVLPFTFCFFGDNYTNVWMNNNGNISFSNGLSAYSSNAFPSNGNKMIAAFWADFDLNGTGSMHATITPTAAIFNWVAAGYYSAQTNKVNTCQIVITNGIDPLVQGGNVAIHYGDMQWTTGSASGGTNGFGGTPATAGANRGNNIDYFQIGQFDHAGVDYDGPNGAIDGVDWLDNKSFYFDFCSVGNLAPIPLETSYCDTLQVCSVGDTLDISFPFLSPENTQITTVNYNAPTLSNVQVLSNTPGSSGEITLRIIGQLETIGVHQINITATDNYVPAGVTNVTYSIEVFDAANAFTINPVLDFNTQCAPMTFQVLNGPYDGYTWETGATTPTISINNYFNEELSVTLEKSGCRFTIDSLVYVPSAPIFNLQGNLFYCEGTGGTSLYIPDSLIYGNISWGLSNPAADTLYSATLGSGSYTIEMWDMLNLCSNDTTFTVVEIPQPTIFNDTIGCFLTFQVGGTTSAAGGFWSVLDNPLTAFLEDTAVVFSPSNTVANPAIVTSTPGTYTFTYTDSACQTTLSSNVYFPPGAWTEVLDMTICENTPTDLVAAVNGSAKSYLWNTGETSSTITVTKPGIYWVEVINDCYVYRDSAKVITKRCDIDAPNVISLSSKNGNHLFFVKHDGVESFHCTITNRWGNILHEFDDPDGTWDGKNSNGKLLDEGVYFYIIDATMFNGNVLKKHGTINLFH